MFEAQRKAKGEEDEKQREIEEVKKRKEEEEAENQRQAVILLHLQNIKPVMDRINAMKNLTSNVKRAPDETRDDNDDNDDKLVKRICLSSSRGILIVL